MKRHVEQRCGVPFDIDTGDEEASIIFKIAVNIPEDGFSIEDGEHGEVVISASSQRGLLHGLGKYLRTSTFKAGEFIPGSWRGLSLPEKHVRAVYFATHFFNYYHVAPINEIREYIEDLALWGFNTIIVWYDMHHFSAINDPAAAFFIDRLRAILASAKGIGLHAGLTLLANEAYAGSPVELRANQTFPKTKHIRGGYGLELCPSKPAGIALIERNFSDEFRAFDGIGIDFVMIWPYDQGGCSCPECTPWGANGFLRAAERVASLARQQYPGVKVILSTWLFDPVADEGEWTGMARKFKTKPDWVDFILADSHASFPNYPLDNGVPGGLPLLNFPEISMWGMSPWGGYGANPLPARFQGFWNRIKDSVAGGVLYSEGIFEDVNKVIWARFYWSKDTLAVDTVREYVTYEFPGCNVDEVVKAIVVLEQNHRGFSVRRWRKRPKPDAGSKLASRAFIESSQVMPLHVTGTWRWKVLFHRAMLDVQRFRGHPYPNDVVKLALDELAEIYHAKHAELSVCPPRLKIARQS